MEEKEIIIDKLSINYKNFGGNNGPAVLVLHGWGVGSDSWVEAAVLLAQEGLATPEHCAKAGYRVVVPDMPGFGKSAVPARAWMVDDYVEWVKHFAEALKLDKFVLIGHSFGGQVAAKFAAIYPNKVDKLILCAAAVIRRERLGRRQKIARFLSKGKINKKYIPFGIYPVLRKIVYCIGGAKDYALAQGVMAEIFQNVSKYNALPYAYQVKTPTLIVWGDKDNETPVEDAHEINRAITGSRLEIISDAGHKLHRTHTQELAGIINSFLNLKS